MAMIIKGIFCSVYLFLFGIFRRAGWWIPAFLIKPLEIYQKYFKAYFGWDIQIEPDYFLYALSLGLIAAAIATFHDLRIKYERAVGYKLEVFFGEGEPFEQIETIEDSHGNHGTSRLFRIGVKNTGSSTIERVEVKLEKISPPAPKLLGVTLHVRHDNPADGNYRVQFPLDPGVPEYVDVVTKNEWGQQAGHPIQICHIVRGIQYALSPKRHELTIVAHGHDAQEARKVFVVDVGNDGCLLFRPTTQGMG